MLSVTEATQRIQTAIARLGLEITGIDDALGRFLATEITAGRNLPPHDNSAMDGFAVFAADLAGASPAGAPVRLPVSGTIAAGDRPDAELAAGHTWRIMTGAPMPAGADAVVIREDVQDHGDHVEFTEPAAVGQNLRRAGEDIAIGDPAMPAGMRLGPGEIGLLAALGHAAVAVGKRPRVAVMSTGDELVGVDVAPRPGQIVNSNAHALAAQIREAGGTPIQCGIAPDNRDTLVTMIRRALAADVLVTSGGVSVGDFDYVKAAFADAGVSMDFWKVAMKPGKPLAFGVTDTGTPVFGLPGNPVSSMVVFELFVRPSLLAMQGAARIERPRIEATLARTYTKRPGRAHYLRAHITRDGDTVRADTLTKQGSGMLSSMVDIDALVIIDRDATEVPAGTQVPAILLRS